MPKPQKYRELERILSKHDKRFEFWIRKGKGSHRTIYHPDINGKAASFPLKCHGRNTEIHVGAISAIIRRFDLPKGLL